VVVMVAPNIWSKFYIYALDKTICNYQAFISANSQTVDEHQHAFR